MSEHKQVEHLFRHEYGKLVALFMRRVGIQHLDKIEDAVQWAMAQALEFWPKSQHPKSPSAWLYRVAYRQLLSEFRTSQRRDALLIKHASSQSHNVIELEEEAFSGEMNDAMLRMLFAACNNQIPIESQLVFTLKSLCGFSVREIALRLFITEANVYKRFSRAKSFLQKSENENRTFEIDTLLEVDITARLSSVHKVLYLVFTEGYLSSHDDMAIREDLCQEAIRLTQLLTASKFGNVPESYALLALMYFHLARLNTRQDDYGSLLLLEQQDRSQWNNSYITIAMDLLEKSAQGNNISRYHIEAGIVAEHCMSPSFNKTNWEMIVTSYQLLNQISPSPLHTLNEAIAMAQWQGARAGLAVLQLIDIPDWLDRSYHWYTVQADLLFRCGEQDKALKYAELAIAAAPTDNIKRLLHQRLWCR